MDFLEILMDPMELNGDSMEILDFLSFFFGILMGILWVCFRRFYGTYL